MKTKKSVFGMLAVALLATGCNSEFVETADSQNGNITFQTVLGKQTRATEFSYWGDSEGFTAKAYLKGTTTPFKDFTLTCNGTNSWTVSGGTVAHPGYPLDYYAWSPSDATGATFTPVASASTLEYTIPVVDSQVDLVAAYKPNHNNAAVDLTFYHILSQVNFAVQGVSNVKIAIKDITIKGVSNHNTYTFGTGWGGTPDGSASYVYKAKSYGAGDGTTYTSGTNTLTTDGTKITEIKLGSGASTDGNALMLMPQSFNSSSTATMEFTYTLTAMDGTTPLGTGTTSAYLRDFTTTTWEVGKRYLYIIDFTEYFKGGNITFSVTVDTWKDNENVTQVLEVADATQVSIDAAIERHRANHGSYTIFPISIPKVPTGNITLGTIGDGFSATDKIVLNFTAGLNSYTVNAPTGWTAATVDKIVTLTKTP